MVGTSKPRSARKASSSIASTLARERSFVVSSTLPVLMWVATSVAPVDSTQARISSLANLRLAPRLMARRKATYDGMPAILPQPGGCGDAEPRRGCA